MTELSLKLAENRKRYRELSREQRNNVKVGGQLLKTIQKQDQQIKKLDATLGNHQRNVGNYPKTWEKAGLAMKATLVGMGLAVFNFARNVARNNQVIADSLDFIGNKFRFFTARNLRSFTDDTRETGGILTGMSNPYETPGEKLDVDQAWTMTHLEHAITRMPILEEAQLLRQWAGLYEVTPDNQPVIGALPVEGLYTCTGFSGHGFMHSPAIGRILAELILNGETSFRTIELFSLERFNQPVRIMENSFI